MTTREKLTAIVVVTLILICSHRMAYLTGFQDKVIQRIEKEVVIGVQTYLKSQGIDLKLNNNTN